MNDIDDMQLEMQKADYLASRQSETKPSEKLFRQIEKARDFLAKHPEEP